MGKTTAFLLVILHLIASIAWADPVSIPKTGQRSCYDGSGNNIPCAGTGQDGELQKGVAWPTPRFTENGNGTVTDTLTGLIWLRNANCTDTVGGINKSKGTLAWVDALTWSNNLANGSCGLTDGSSAGNWRLPNVNELKSLINFSEEMISLPAGHPFSGVQSNYYWSSTTYAYVKAHGWVVSMGNGLVVFSDKRSYNYLWPVRGGQ